MKPIPFPQINGRHPSSSPPIIARIVRLNGLNPEVTDTLVTVFPEPDVGEEITKVVAGMEIRCRRLGCPGVDTTGEQGGTVPAAEGASAIRFVVKGCTKGDDSFDLGSLQYSERYAERYSGVISPYPAPTEPF